MSYNSRVYEAEDVTSEQWSTTQSLNGVAEPIVKQRRTYRYATGSDSLSRNPKDRRENPYYLERFKTIDDFLTLDFQVKPEIDLSTNPYLTEAPGTYRETLHAPFGAMRFPGDKAYEIDQAVKWAAYKQLAKMDMELGESILQAQKTIDMVSNRVSQLANLYMSLRRGRNPWRGRYTGPDKHRQREQRREDRKTPGELWLEYSYGWVPLVNDVYAVMGIPLLEPKPQYIRKRGSGTHEEEVISEYAMPPGSVLVKYYGIHSFKQTAVLKVSYNHDTALAQRFGLLNPAYVAWTLMPYSFVVDWFIPIGDFINIMTGPRFYTIKDSSVTYAGHGAQIVSTDGTVISESPLHNVAGKPAAARSTFRYKYRNLGTIATPDLRFKPQLSLSNWTSAFALLQQAFDSPFRYNNRGSGNF